MSATSEKNISLYRFGSCQNFSQKKRTKFHAIPKLKKTLWQIASFFQLLYDYLSPLRKNLLLIASCWATHNPLCTVVTTLEGKDEDNRGWTRQTGWGLLTGDMDTRFLQLRRETILHTMISGIFRRTTYRVFHGKWDNLLAYFSACKSPQ